MLLIRENEGAADARLGRFSSRIKMVALLSLAPFRQAQYSYPDFIRPRILSERSSGKQPIEILSSVWTETSLVFGIKSNFCLQDSESRMSRLATLMS